MGGSYMKNNINVKIFIKINGTYVAWDTLGEEKREEIGKVLNDRALRALGYIPEAEVEKKRRNKNI